MMGCTHLNYGVNMKTLEELLRMKMPAKNKDGENIEVTPSFRVAVQGERVGGIHIIVHPVECSGDTLDFIVRRNELLIP
jgi:hypothetical protein